MKLVDLNLLLDAINRDSPRHEGARIWLEEALTGEEPVGLPWAVILGFLRISTHARFFSAPLSAEYAVSALSPRPSPRLPRLDHGCGRCGSAGATSREQDSLRVARCVA